MKVLVITSSPKDAAYSVTQMLTDQFVAGLQEAGAEADVYNLNRMSIHHCMDCGACSTMSQGKCVIKDDMSEILFPKFLSADALVLASPIYFGMLNSVMKKFIERLYPYLGIWQEIRDGIVYQAFRGPFPKVVMISAASWQFPYVFEQLSGYMRYLFEDQLVGELYRGSSDAFIGAGMVFHEKKQEILLAAKQAGRELAEHGFVSGETSAAVCQDLDQPEKTVAVHNMVMKLCQEEQVTTTQFEINRQLDHGTIKPRTIDSLMDVVKVYYQDRDEDVNLRVQIITKGKLKEACFFAIERGKLRMGKEMLEAPDITLKSAMDTLSAIMSGEIGFMDAVMQGKMIVKGKTKALNQVSEYLFTK